MAKLTPIQIVGDAHNANEAGWYAENEQHQRIMGPFPDENACKDAIAAAQVKGATTQPHGAMGAGG